MDFTLTGAATAALITVLQDFADGGDVTFTKQGDGSLTVGFSLATVTIAEDGATEDN